MSFSEKLKETMQDLDLNQKQVVGMTGKSKGSISQYLSGKQIPSEKVQSDIAISLGLNPDYFKNEENPVPFRIPRKGTIPRLDVVKAAQLLGMNHDTVRKGLQQGAFPWGYKLLDDFKVKLQSAIANMSPAKFEQFSRALLTKMGVQFTNKGVQISNDGGIDGYGYHIDDDDFRTTRVVIQCKRFNANPVSEPDINQFLGAMNKFQADYGVFITNSRFTNKAREAAREGTPITLIDGNDLVRLVIKYELFITPVTTYVMEDFYTEE